MNTQQLTRIFHFLGWMTVIAIAVLTAGPGELRPHTFVPAQIERFATYFVASSLLAFGNIGHRRMILIGMLMTLYAGALETAQLWIPGRDAGIIDFAAKASGAWFGVLLVSTLRFFTIVREMVRALAMLPLPAKFLVGLIIPVIFVVVTQWQHLTFKQPPAPATSKVSISPQQSEQRSFDFPDAPPADKTHAADVEAYLSKRMARAVIVEPKAPSQWLDYWQWSDIVSLWNKTIRFKKGVYPGVRRAMGMWSAGLCHASQCNRAQNNDL